MRFFVEIGRYTISALRETGRMVIFLFQFMVYVFQPPLRPYHVIKEMYIIGVKSLFVIVLIAAFAGMVLSLQGYYALQGFGSESYLGATVSMTLIRELGPVLGAVMVAARAGSAMAAELGIMQISEQIDALDVMTLNPFKFLVIPKILAAILVVPLLVSIFDVVGIFSGYLIGVNLLGVSSGSYMHEVASGVVFKDVFGGIIKSLVFGLILAWISCYKGYFCERGAKGVGKATTEAVVLSSVLIFVLDYFLTSILL
ncbi:MAG: MlaE family lipid ABC transporter permease subunit [Thermodesulfobacteriota bacterium]|nr:MAG: MlaE family lipid ABC transporter permease subunit [Thermodesulfobacteriota bacterium]